MNKRKHKTALLLVTLVSSFILLSSEKEVFAGHKPNGKILASIKGNETDTIYDFKKTSDGGYIAVGGTDSINIGVTNYGDDDGIIVKYDSDFNQQWIKSWGGSARDYFKHVTGTSDGGFVATGIMFSTDIPGLTFKGGYDTVVVKYDKNGNLLWQKNFGGNDSEDAGGVTQLKDGSLIIVGYSHSRTTGFEGQTVNGNGDMFIIKLNNSNGSLQWAKTFGSNSCDYLYDVVATSDGGFAVAGCTGTEAFGAQDSYDGYVAKFNSSGTKLWERIYHEDGFLCQEYFNAIDELPNGDIVVVGNAEDKDNMPYISVYSSAGAFKWSDTIQTAQDYNDTFEKVTVSNNKIYAVGRYSSETIDGEPYGNDTINPIIVVYDFNGNRELLKVVETESTAYCGGVEVDKNEDIVIAVRSWSNYPPYYETGGRMDAVIMSLTPFPDTGVEVTITNPATNWTNEDFNLIIKVENPNGGLSHVILPDGNKTILEEFEYKVTQNGNLTFVAVDIYDVEHKLEVVINNIDKTPPRFDSIEVTYPDNLIHGDITFSGSDDLSGIDKIIKPDGTTTNESSGTHRVITNETFEFIIVDKAGNSTSATIVIDKVNMRHVLVMTNELKPTYLEKRGVVDIKATLDDEENDEAVIKYSINDNYETTFNGKYKPKNTPVNLNLSFRVPSTLPPGKHTLKIWAEDTVLKTTSNVIVLNLNIYGNSPHTLTANPLKAEYFEGETVNVTGTISDADNDEAVIRYSIDDKNVQELPGTFRPEDTPIDYSFSFVVSAPLAEGSHSLKIWAIDTESAKVSNTINLELKIVGDFIPPNIFANPEERLTFERTGLDVDISFIDEGFSGFDAYRYHVSGEMNRPSEWSQWIANETDTIHVDGSHMNYLHIEARDNNGNVGYRVFGTYNIDNEPPSIDYEVDNSDFTNEDVTITIYTADNEGGSGINFVELPDGNTMKSETFNYTVSTNGNYIFSVTDNVGLTSSVTVNISNIDKEAPDINFTLSETGYTNQNVTITAEAFDNGVSGVQSMFLPDLTTTTNNRVDFVATDNDTYEFIVEDRAGNITTKTVVIDKMDKVIPTIKVSVDKIENKIATLIVEAKDNVGLAELTTSTGEVVPISGKDYYAELTTNVHGTANFSVKDLAGNTNSTSIHVDLAQIPIPDSGINRIEYKLEGATEKNWTIYNGPFYISNEGTTTVKARCFDNAGNESDTIYIYVNTDKTKPHKNLISIAPIHINKG